MERYENEGFLFYLLEIFLFYIDFMCKWDVLVL